MGSATCGVKIPRPSARVPQGLTHRWRPPFPVSISSSSILQYPFQLDTPRIIRCVVNKSWYSELFARIVLNFRPPTMSSHDGVRPRRPPPSDNLPPTPLSPTTSYSDREDGQLGKKRKTPSSMQCGGRDEYSWDRHTNHTCAHGQKDGDESESPFQRKNGKWVLNYYRARSRAAKAGSWRKALFLRRKAALITLFLDAQTAVTNELKKGVERSSLILPEVAMFEQMLPSLENIAVGEWPMDNPGWRSGSDETGHAGAGALEHWRTGFEKRRRLMEGRKTVVRGGWAPEGSFEFEKRSEGESYEGLGLLQLPKGYERVRKIRPL